MNVITKEKLISILEEIAKNTPELNNFKSALLIGSHAAYEISKKQRKPKDASDWDFMISASCFLEWLHHLKDQIEKMEIMKDSTSTKAQPQKPKSFLENFFFGKDSSNSNSEKSQLDNQSSINSLAVHLIIIDFKDYPAHRKTLDMEVPTSLNSSVAQLLLYEFSNHDNSTIKPASFNSALQVKVASLEVLLGLKKTTYNPTRWLRHIEDFHNLASETDNHIQFSKELNSILELSLKESAQIHKIEIKEVDTFDIHEFLKATPDVKELMKNYNSSSWKLSQSQFQQPTTEKIEFVVQLLEAYTHQNKLFSPLASMEILATSKSPSRWWKVFLQDHYPAIQQTLLHKIPTLTTSVSTSTMTPSVWIFPQLPFEIAVTIASYMDITSQYQASKLSSVSKSWNTFFSNDNVWKAMYEQVWKQQPVPKTSWKTNFIICKYMESNISNPTKLEELIQMTAKFQQSTVDELISIWKTLLKISQLSEASLKFYLRNIHRLQWMLQHTFILDASHSPSTDDYGPSICSMDFIIGCKELPKFSHRYNLHHSYGEKGSSRYSVEAHELLIKREGNRIRKFDGPGLYGLLHGKWGLCGIYEESWDLSTRNSLLFDLPEGIITAFFIQIAECQKHVKSYFSRDWESSITS